MSQAAGVWVMAGAKAESAKYATRERRSHRLVSPKELLSPEPFAHPPLPGDERCLRERLASRPARVPPR